MKFGDTLSEDQFTGFEFDFVISNPPFGIDWKREAPVVEMEYKKGEAGRFAPGLPSKSDGQMLFMLNGIKKLKPGKGKMAIIQNGSSLSTGDAGSGPSEIRKYIIENDWLDAIVQLPNDSFYNTGIATYIWIIDKEKPLRNPGNILLIDASMCGESRFKPIGNKRKDITEKCRNLIVKAYGEYADGSYSDTLESGEEVLCKASVVQGVSLGYTKITVETPQRDENGAVILKKGKKVADTSLRDVEKVSLTEEISDYMKNEVLPFNSEAWVDEKKNTVGYEINMKQFFYEYTPVEPAETILERISLLEERISSSLAGLLKEVR